MLRESGFCRRIAPCILRRHSRGNIVVRAHGKAHLQLSVNLAVIGCARKSLRMRRIRAISLISKFLETAANLFGAQCVDRVD